MAYELKTETVEQLRDRRLHGQQFDAGFATLLAPRLSIDAGISLSLVTRRTSP